MLLSRRPPVAVKAAAEQAGIVDWPRGPKPGDKVNMLEIKPQGHLVMMVGDGLKMRPLWPRRMYRYTRQRRDVSQTVATLSFKGISCVCFGSVAMSQTRRPLINKTFALSFVYNILTGALGIGRGGDAIDCGDCHVHVQSGGDFKRPAPESGRGFCSAPNEEMLAFRPAAHEMQT